MDLSLLLTIAFGMVSVFAFIYALRESRKAKNAEKRMMEIENAVVSYKYLKEKAYEYYNQGRYEDSLDVFRKYFLDNKDEKEWVDVIVDIYKKETTKIFTKYLMPQDNYPISLLLQVYITNETEFTKLPSYPTIIKKLYEQYKNIFKKDIANITLLLLVFDKKWSEVRTYLQKTPIIINDKETGELYKKFIIGFIDKKDAPPDFPDDIPF